MTQEKKPFVWHGTWDEFNAQVQDAWNGREGEPVTAHIGQPEPAAVQRPAPGDDAEAERLRDQLADSARTAIAACEKLAKIRQACENPKQVAGTSHGLVVNGESLARIVLGIIGGA